MFLTPRRVCICRAICGAECTGSPDAARGAQLHSGHLRFDMWRPAGTRATERDETGMLTEAKADIFASTSSSLTGTGENEPHTVADYRKMCVRSCACMCGLTLSLHSPGHDPVLPSQCVSLYPPEVGAPPGLRHHVRHGHPEAVQVLPAETQSAGVMRDVTFPLCFILFP